MKFIIGYFLLFASLLTAVDTDGFDVQVHLSAQQISIEDLLKVELTLKYPSGYQPDLGILQKNIARSSDFYGHPFALNHIQVDEPKNVGGAIVSHVNLELQPIHIGSLLFTLYDFVFVNTETKKTTNVVTPVMEVHVLPIQAPVQFAGHLSPLLTFSKTYPLELDSENELNAIDNAEEDVAQIQQKQLPWIETLVFMALVLLFWVFLKAAALKPDLSPEEKLKLAKQQALADLVKLKEENLPSKGFFDEFYVELTHSVRSYIENKFHLPVSSSTTPEFLKAISVNTAFPKDTRQNLSQFLSVADKVKFGQYRPSQEECEKAQALAIHLVESE